VKIIFDRAPAVLKEAKNFKKRSHKNTPRLTNEERADKLVWDILCLLDTTCSHEEAKSLAKLILKSFQLVSKETLARKKRRES